MSDMRGDAGGPYEKAPVDSVIDSVLEKVALSGHGADGGLYQEILSLKNMMDDLRISLNAVAPHDIMHSHLPNATDELSAITGLTEDAANKIMSACEDTQKCIESMPQEVQERITANIISIFEACTFQDITGQRVSKIVSALQKVEEKFARIMAVLIVHLGERGVVFDPFSAAGVVMDDDSFSAKSLMNGPQLPGCGITQDDIDRMLNE